jgi:hypothetical protein
MSIIAVQAAFQRGLGEAASCREATMQYRGNPFRQTFKFRLGTGEMVEVDVEPGVDPVVMAEAVAKSYAGTDLPAVQEPRASRYEAKVGQPVRPAQEQGGDRP